MKERSIYLSQAAIKGGKIEEMREHMFWVCFSAALSMPFLFGINECRRLIIQLLYCSTHPESFETGTSVSINTTPFMHT